MSNGNIIVKAHKKASGAPFSAASAFLGTSVDTATGKIQLGNAFGDPLKPAEMTGQQEIVTNGTGSLFLSDAPGAPGSSLELLAQNINLLNFLTSTNLTLNPGQVTIGDFGTDVAELAFSGTGAGPLASFRLIFSAGVLLFCDNNSVPVFSMDLNNKNFTALLGALLTMPPAGPAGAWKLGQFTAGAVALDVANYVEVEIDGVVRKVLVAV